MTSISIVTRLTQKVKATRYRYWPSSDDIEQLDFDKIVDKSSKSAMTAGLAEAPALIQQIGPDPLESEADWGKLRSLELVEMLHKRRDLLKQRGKFNVQDANNFEDEYRSMHVHRTLEDRIAGLVVQRN